MTTINFCDKKCYKRNRHMLLRFKLRFSSLFLLRLSALCVISFFFAQEANRIMIQSYLMSIYALITFDVCLHGIYL